MKYGLASLIRRRLEALARHPVERIRCQAYSIMLLNRPMTDYRTVFPAFIQSGLSFLNDEFIQKLAAKKIEKASQASFMIFSPPSTTIP